MRAITVGAALAAVAIAVSVLHAGKNEELASGPKPGDYVGAFDVKKCAGNENDGVAVGEELCYRCRMGSRPVVMIFARESDKALAKLIKELDKAVVKHEDAKLVAFVNLLGEDREALAKKAKEFVEDTQVKNVAVVVPIDQKGTEEQFHLNPDADLTVVLYNKSVVKASHAIKGDVENKLISQIVEEAGQMLD